MEELELRILKKEIDKLRKLLKSSRSNQTKMAEWISNHQKKSNSHDIVLILIISSAIFQWLVLGFFFFN